MYKYYKFMNICWKISANKDVLNSIDKLLADYFREIEMEEEIVDFCVSLNFTKYKDMHEILEFGKHIVIHNSKKTAVQENGIEYRNGLTSAIFNCATKSVYVINYLAKTIDIYNMDVGVLHKDGIRVVRDIVKVLAEENDSIMLHAAALYKEGYGGIILVGGKGSGKTSISLDLLYNHKFVEVSRDRIMLHKSKKDFVIYGWPNYYNLTIRTINSYSKTRCLVPKEYANLTIEEMEAINKKIQFTAEDIGIEYKMPITPLNHIFYLNNKAKESSLSKEELLAVSCYTPEDLNYPNWHRWRVNDRKEAIVLAESILHEVNSTVVNWENLDEATNIILKSITVKSRKQ